MSIFICPYCREKLSVNGRSYSCKNSHVFDIASEGYVYLLPPNKKHSKLPGDTKQMINSRRDFLNAGYYDIFSDKINSISLEILKDKTFPTVIDAGCGEGYYTGNLRDYLERNSVNPSIGGVDISKFAVKAAAKRYKGIEFAVGSIFDMPFADETADLLINIFAPIMPEEFNRVLKSGAYIIIAVPGARHMFGLKKILYEDPYENEYKETEYDGFTFVDRISVKKTIELDNNKDIMDLFSMTPYYWKTPASGSASLKMISKLETEIHFDFLIYKKM